MDSNNNHYIESLYEAYLDDPNSVSESWNRYFSKEKPSLEKLKLSQVRLQFESMGRVNKRIDTVVSHSSFDYKNRAKQVRVLQLINSYRQLGHLVADINILEVGDKKYVPELTLGYHGLSPNDYDKEFHTGSLMDKDRLSLREIFTLLNKAYCGTVGSQYMYISNILEKRWLQGRIEGRGYDNKLSNEEKKSTLYQLIAADALERYLHRKYVGKKRFSLEGGDVLIPMLHALIQHAGKSGTKEIILGMAHRGRLNVLVNIMGKAPATLFDEFEGRIENFGRSGDVKYHLGFASDMVTPGGNVHLSLAFNPSHLEIVNPVVEGSVRARQDRRDENSAVEVIPLVIHGDAAFAGQGVNMETLNMSETRGFRTYGTIHIVINNQIGFTTSTQLDSRSTEYCTDLMKMVNAPVFHVNADDPEAVVEITRLAVDYRMKFHKDIIIDLVCYRRHGHNEADEPSATQPRMYRQIKGLASPQIRYADRLLAEKVITQAELKSMRDKYDQALKVGNPTVDELLVETNYTYEYMVDWKRYRSQHWRQQCKTQLSNEDYERFGLAMCDIPNGFQLNGRVAKIVEQRKKMAKGDIAADWGFAENLAYASLLDDNYKIRISGEDCRRGTFFHRHVAFHEQNTSATHVPLEALNKQDKAFVVIDSLLSEEAVLGFEYGYAATEAETLVVWEAQFGDFANGAQVVIDQFISSAEQKWGLLNGIVLLLPHGYEGMGPEHSSARLERYLQLCAQDNMQVCIPSTPSQIFHLLCRQMIRPYRKPLIVMTPKSLLRHPLAVSHKNDFIQGSFQCVIDEMDTLDTSKVNRVVLCSGKIYYELLEYRRKKNIETIAIIRLEQLYPFPDQELHHCVSKYNHAEFVWCQEEPLNQGAWFLIQSRLEHIVGRRHLSVVSRPPMAAAAEGLYKDHLANQYKIIKCALKKLI